MRFAITAVMLAVTAGRSEASIIMNTPSGVGTVSTSQYLAWDMTSSNTLVGSGPDGLYEFALTNHGDIHGSSIVQKAPGSDGAAKLAAGTLISGASSFSPYGYAGTTSFNGLFTANSTGLIGVRFQIAGQTHYGWAEITFSGGNQTLNRWAYEDQANVGILAGATGTPTVPEPTSLALAGFAGIGMAVGAWRRRRQQKQAA